MKHLSFYGHWVISDEVREVMFGTTFTKLRVLYEFETLGYTLTGWLSSLKSVAGLHRAQCSLEGEALVGKCVLKSHGLVPYSDPPCSGGNSNFEGISNSDQYLGKKTTFFFQRAELPCWTYSPDNQENDTDAGLATASTTPV